MRTARRAAEARADAFEAQRDMTEIQLAAAVRARDDAQFRLDAESEARDAAEAENRRLRELIRRMENR